MNRRKKTVKLRGYLSFGFVFALVFACTTAEERLAPPKSTSEYRLEDLEKNVLEAPEKALHLAEVYRVVYGPNEETEIRLKKLE
ncbi:MAG: hypothetical protein LBP69_01220 [Treponema sp.]|jgi:hypothetical protein|nr:hypothetical protein [Treponema sp.]